MPGGSGFHLRNMIEVLIRDNHHIEVFHCYDQGGYDQPIDTLVFCTYPINAFDVVIADYSWMCPVFDLVPEGVLKICFVHDLRCRIIPCLEAIGYKDAQGWTEKREAKLLQKADILLVLNDEDAAFCRCMAPAAKIVRIGIAMEPVAHDPAKEVPGRCIYVGSHNMENQYALAWFLREVWGRVLRALPSATLDIVYGHPDDIGERYAQAQLAVAPHIMNGGKKLKVAQAFVHGLPVVGNVCAFDGFPICGRATDYPAKMAESIISLLKDDFERKDASEWSVALAKVRMTPQSAYGELLEMLKCA